MFLKLRLKTFHSTLPQNWTPLVKETDWCRSPDELLAAELEEAWLQFLESFKVSSTEEAVTQLGRVVNLVCTETLWVDLPPVITWDEAKDSRLEEQSRIITKRWMLLIIFLLGCIIGFSLGYSLQ
jgi:hypothetical protein